MFNYLNEDGEVNGFKVVGHLFLFLFVFTLLLSSFGAIGAGERGVKTRFKAVVGVLPQGLYFKLPIIERVIKMNVKTQSVLYEREDPLASASKDLQDVKIATVVNYHISPDTVKDVYVQYGYQDDYEEQVVRPAVRDIVKATASQFTAEELVTKRAEFTSAVLSRLNERLSVKYAVVEQVNITNFEFSEAFTQAIEAKVTATQNAEAAKNKLEQVKFEAEQTIAKSKADAEAIRIKAAAITQQGGHDYVQLQAIEKWNGILPQQFVPGSAIPFLDLK